LCHSKIQRVLKGEEVEDMLKCYKVLIMVMILILSLGIGASRVHAQFGLGGAPPSQKVDPKVLSTGNGRFVFGQISESNKDKFMLDTFSGRLWHIAESGEVGIFLRPVPYRVGEGTYDPLPENLPSPGSEPKNKEKKAGRD
jgi:hypothetical protein